MENPLLRPFLKAPMGGGTGTNPCGVQGIPLATGMQHEKNGIEHDTIILAFSASLAGVWILFGRNPWMNLCPKFVRKFKSLFCHGLPSLIGRVSLFMLPTSTV
jgi:hypothetical protein